MAGSPGGPHLGGAHTCLFSLSGPSSGLPSTDACLLVCRSHAVGRRHVGPGLFASLAACGTSPGLMMPSVRWAFRCWPLGVLSG